MIVGLLLVIVHIIQMLIVKSGRYGVRIVRKSIITLNLFLLIGLKGIIVLKRNALMLYQT